MFYYYLICCILSVALSAAYAFIWRRRFHVCFTIVQIMIPSIMIAVTMRAAASTLDSAVPANNIVYVAGCFLIPLLFFGIASICDIQFKRPLFLSAFAVQILVYVLILADPHIGWFYTSVSLSEANGCSVLVKEYGPVHTAVYALIFIYLFAMLVLLLYSYRNKRRACQKHILIVAALLPVCVLLYAGTRWVFGAGQEDVITYLICQLLVLYISKDTSYYSVDAYLVDPNNTGTGLGCIALDENQRLLTCNVQAEEWFPELTKLHAGRKIQSEEGINGRFANWIERLSSGEKSFVDVVKSKDLSIQFDISVKNVDGRRCYIFIMTDDTTQQEMLKVLNSDVERVTGAVKQYVDPHTFVNMLEGSKVSEDGQEFTIAIMFADLRGFTSLSENIETRRIISILNRYLSLAEDAIHKYGGILDKYIGDEVMAYWIDIKGDGSAAEQAAKAAMEMKNSMLGIEDSVYSDIATELFYGIGMNYGKAILGNVGSENLKSYTAIGDTVNVAARLQSIAPKNTVYITEAFKNALGNRAEVSKVESELRVKGKAASLKAFELISVGNASLKTEQKNETAEPVSKVTNDTVKLHICGCRGSYPVSGVRFSKFGGETSCYVLKINQHAVVIDCGTGLQNAEALLADCTKIDVLLTHMHYDHVIGLLNWGVFPPGITPTFYGNFDDWFGKNSIKELFRHPFWPVDVSRGELVSVPIGDEKIILSMQEGISVRFFNSEHPNGSKLILVEIGSKRVCFMCDCEQADAIPLRYLKGIHYLVYDGMYDDFEYVKHVGWGHSTWQEGVRLAQTVGAEQLIITHHDAKSSDAVLTEREEKARAIRKHVNFAKVGDQYTL